MAVTQGHGNPLWSRDETLLALNLYQRLSGQVPGPDDHQIIELSRQLQALPIHQEAKKRDSFRNPAGVAFKLQNIRQVATGRGLGNVSELDRAIWSEYGNSPELVQQLVDSIHRNVADEAVTEAEVAAISPEEEFAEGRLLTAVHHRRERNPKLRMRLLSRRQADGAIHCDCCNDAPKITRPNLALAGFEVHHVIPLAESIGNRTRLSDLALLCATCHRLIHRAMQVQRRWVGVAELRLLIR